VFNYAFQYFLCVSVNRELTPMTTTRNIGYSGVRILSEADRKYAQVKKKIMVLIWNNLGNKKKKKALKIDVAI